MDEFPMADEPARHNLSANLRYLCQFRKSASFVAREIRVNRQQFERYLTGAALPSPNILLRIAAYFGVAPALLTRAPEALRAAARSLGTGVAVAELFSPEYSPGELATLRRYLGFYQSHFLTPAAPGRIYIGLVWVKEDDHRIRTVYMNRSRDPNTRGLYRSRYDGHLMLRGEHLFQLEKSRHGDDNFAETILYPSHRHSGKYLTGISMGITWRPDRAPFATRTIWRRVPQSRGIRSVIGECGIYWPDHPLIDPVVRGFMGEDPVAYSLHAEPAPNRM
jgi:transcriptional regulator with XRE-family HTH domain